MNNYQVKISRDTQIINCLTKFKICSRNQLAHLFFKENTLPINVCNRTMKRLSMGGSVLQIPRSRDKTYCYTANPSPISHKSNKIDHHLSIVDFYIKEGVPEKFLVEPIFGSYEPDIYFEDKTGKQICVEIQLTPISNKKMQKKVNDFVSEFKKNHMSNTLVLCSNYDYKSIEIAKGFRLIKQPIPCEIFL